MSVIFSPLNRDDCSWNQILTVKIVQSQDKSTPIWRWVAQFDQVRRERLRALKCQHGRLLAGGHRTRQKRLQFGVVGEQAMNVFVERQRVIDRFARAIDWRRRLLVEQVTIISAYFGQLPPCRANLRKSARAPKALIRSTDELEFAMLVGESIVQSKPHKLKIWSSRPHSQHILSEIVVGKRLLLLLHVVTKATQIPATESRNPVLHEPLLAKVCDSRIGAKSFPQRDRKVDIVDLSHVSRLGSLGGNSPGNRRRRLLDGFFHDRRLSLRFDGRFFIDLESGNPRQNIDLDSLRPWPRSRRRALGLRQRCVKSRGERMPGLCSCDSRRASVSSRYEIPLTLHIIDREHVRVCRDNGINPR